MNEETNVELMDNDDLGFDAADFPEFEDTGEEAGEIATPPAAARNDSENREPEVATAAEPPRNDSGETKDGEKEPELFELNWLGQTQKHTREEMIALAQKGMDRDRILQQRDAAQQFRTQNEGVINDLGRVAKLFGLEPAALVSTMEANLLRQQGKTQAEAEAIIRANRADRELQTYHSQEETARQQQAAAQERQQRDIREFCQRYPNVDAKTIPTSVWQEVQRGDTLVNAYGRYEMQQLRAENQRLQQQLATKTQNDNNKQKSLGSMQSGTADLKADPFMEGFSQGW